MREGHGALIRRAAAALGASVALHVVLVLAGGPLPLRALLGAVSQDRTPLIVEMIGGEVVPAARSGPARPAGSRPARPAPVSLPPIAPLPAEAPSPAIEPSIAAEAPALEVDSEPSARAPVEGPTLLAEIAGPGASASPETGVARAGDMPLRAELGPASEEAGGSPPGTEAAPADLTVASTPGAERAADSVAAPETSVPARPGLLASQPLVAPDPRVDLARLDAVARNPSVSARAAGVPFVGRREVFEFLLDHPEFAAHVARALRVARYRIWRTEDGLFVDDGWGATGQMFVVRAASGTRVLYARGEFQNKFLPVITGEAVVTIQYETQPAEDGRDLLVAAISSQLRIDGAFGELVATIANGMATEKAEKESRRLVHIFARVLRAVDEKPASLYASLRERPDVPQRELEQFRVLLKLP